MGVLITNLATALLASSITDIETVVPLAAGKGALFPSPTVSDWFPLVVVDGSDVEIMHCTARSGDTLTVTRGAEGTAAKAFSAGARADLRLTAAALEEHWDDTANPHAVTKAQVGLGSADNTADADKPVSTAQQAAIDSAVAATEFVMSAPAGTRMLFHQTAAPTGWTKETGGAFNNRALRLITGTVGSGGLNSFSAVFGKTATDNHTLTEAQMPSHAHEVTVYNNSGGLGRVRAAGSTSDTTNYFTNPRGGGNAHNHAIDLRVQYNDVIIAQKDA